MRWLLGAIIIGGVIALMVPAVRLARLAALRSERLNHMRQVGMALHNFHDAYKRLPPAVRRDEAGRPLCSWRFQILPFLESMMLGIDFSDQWDDPVNRCLSGHPYWVYCWTAEAPLPRSLHSNIVAVTGPGTAFDGDRETRLADLDKDTILAVEVARSNTHWMEPGDLHIDQIPTSLCHGVDGGGFCVLFADGSAWFINANAPLDDLKKFFTIDDAKQFDREKILRPYLGRNMGTFLGSR
jgi:hypothetical protein